jgi:hypothetical protein
MADKMKVPVQGPDGTIDEKIGTIMEVTESKEPWSEYTLEDGTKIRIKQALVNIVKLDDEKAPNGDPILIIQAQQAMTVIPKNMRGQS